MQKVKENTFKGKQKDAAIISNDELLRIRDALNFNSSKPLVPERTINGGTLTQKHMDQMTLAAKHRKEKIQKREMDIEQQNNTH